MLSSRVCVHFLHVCHTRDLAEWINSAASEWSADRIIRTIPEYLNSDPDSEDSIYFFGEMVRLTLGPHETLKDIDNAYCTA